MFSPNEQGQGLIEYAIMLVVVALVVICLLGVLAILCLGLPAIAATLVIFWESIAAWGTGLVAGILVGNPASTFTAAVIIILVILFIALLPPRRR